MYTVVRDSPNTQRLGNCCEHLCDHCHVDVYDDDVILYMGDQKDCYDTVRKYCQKNIGYNVDHLYKDIQKYIGSEDNTSNYWCMKSVEKNAFTVYLIVVDTLNLEDSEDIGTLVHETLHSANYILNEKGIVDDNSGFESLTYLHEYIFKHFYNKINKKHKVKGML